MLVFYFVNKHREEEDAYDEYADEDQQNLERKGFVRLLSIIPTFAAIYLFILTEDMTAPMNLVDQWTLWMAVFALVNLVLMFLSRKKYNDQDDDQYDAAY